jgi:hypothetical protein
MLTSITIRRFKQLQEITIPLSQLTLLVGANNSGKSSVLQAIHFAVALSQSAKLAGGVSWRNDAYELSLNPSQLLYTPVADVMSLATGGKLAEGKTQQVEIILTANDGTSTTVAISRGRNRNVAISLSGRSLGEKLQDISKPFSIYAPGLAGVPREELYMSAGRVRRIVARGDANLVLRNVLWMLKKKAIGWNRFQEDIAEIFPGITIEVDFDDQTDQYIRASFTRDGGPTLPLDAAGTSLLQAAQLLSYVTLFEPQILVLDEPDSHLHPNNQRRFCKLIANLSTTRQFRILMSTHSRHMLDALRKTSSLIWINAGKIVEGAGRETTALLLDLGALDSLDYFADGQLKYLVATEDEDTSMLESLLWSSGFSKDDTEVVSYSGCSKIDAAVAWGSFIKSKATNLVTIIHRDRDYCDASEAARFCNELQQHGLLPFLTDQNDLECYFLNADHLVDANPGLDKDKATTFISQAIENAKEASIKAIVNLRTHEAHKRRGGNGRQVDHGEIAIAATRDFDASPNTMTRGKETLGRLASLIQQELKQNPRIVVPSRYLAIASLQRILQSKDAEGAEAGVDAVRDSGSAGITPGLSSL